MELTESQRKQKYFLSDSALIRFWVKKKMEAKYGRMILQVAFNQRLLIEKNGGEIPPIVDIGCADFIRKEYGINSRQLAKMNKKAGREARDDITEKGAHAKITYLRREEIQNFLKLWDLFIEFKKLDKIQRKMILFVILYLGRIC